MVGKLLRNFQVPAVGQEFRDPGCAERVGGEHRWNTDTRKAALHHAKHVASVEWRSRLHSSSAIKSREQVARRTKLSYSSPGIKIVSPVWMSRIFPVDFSDWFPDKKLATLRAKFALLCSLPDGK